MPTRLFAGDEGLGKKDDNYKPRMGKGLGLASPIGLDWQQRRLPRRNLKRVAIGLAVLIGLYYFFKNMPTDLPEGRPRPQWNHNPEQGQAQGSRPPVSNGGSMQKPGPEGSLEKQPQHHFNGPIKFYQLASTLHAVSKTRGSEEVNQNVLFAAASLKSASILLPIACEMAIRERNYVHFALFGREDIPMDILKSANGITKECKIIFHDARPDFSMQSTEYRMEVSCSAAFNHVNNFVHPQATFIDASGLEELYFTKGLKERAHGLGRTLIELPEDAEKTLMWTTLLDSNSLGAWDKVSVDILIHAPVFSSGSLIRLLESLKKADFFSGSFPRLTIELSHNIEEPTRRYLENFRWPPFSGQSSGNLLAIHHRIPQHGLSPEENSIRFLEAFWPADPYTSHVLVLSPQAELSPLFFHYLKYTVLEYKYASIERVYPNLLGISLDLPSTFLNDSTTFTPPLVKGDGVSSFLWQAPNSNAALYFGEKWVELHDLVSQLLSSQHTLPTPTTLNEKLIGKTFPSWLEHILKLARARGYWMLYPNFEEASSLATLHNELFQLPEEYAEPTEQPSAGELTADPAAHLSLKHKEHPLITKSLLALLPFGGDLLKVIDMPFLSWNGEVVPMERIVPLAVEYSSIFRREIGGCEDSALEKPRVALMASDLFCFQDAKMEEVAPPAA